MLPDRVSNPGPLTYESGVLPIALRGPAHIWDHTDWHPECCLNFQIWDLTDCHPECYLHCYTCNLGFHRQTSRMLPALLYLGSYRLAKYLGSHRLVSMMLPDFLYLRSDILASRILS